MDLDDLMGEVTVEGLVEGYGAAFAVGIMVAFFFGGMLLPIIEALVERVC